MVERTQMNSQQAIAKTCLKSGENLNIFFSMKNSSLNLYRYNYGVVKWTRVNAQIK